MGDTENTGIRRPRPVQPPTFYAGVGRCIYCNRGDVPLSDEHIVPLSFGGNGIIADASCADCAKATSLIERRIMRELWGKPREALNFPTRRPQRRRNLIELKTAHDAGETSLEVEWEDFPAMFVLPRMDRPGRMRGVPPSKECTLFSPWIGTCGPNQPMDGQVSESFGIGDFVAFVAKMAHSFVFARLGRETFEFWRCLPNVIDGSYPYPFYLVGGVRNEEVSDPFVSETNFATSFTLYSQVLGDLEFLTVGVQMFSDVRGPSYAAIFGARPSSTGSPTKFVCR